MNKVWVVVLAVMAGCAKMHIECPQAGTVVVAVGGSTIGNQVVSGVQTAAKMGMFAAPRAAGTPAGASVDYSFPAIFGPDYARCDVIPPPQPVPIPLPVSVVPNK